MSSAYLLISHGSRDPRPQLAIDRLARQLSLYLQSIAPTAAPPVVATGCLELTDKPLHHQIVDLARDWSAIGIDTIEILPLFLLPGVHVMDDIPAEVAIAERELQHRVKLTLLPFLGTRPDLVDLFARNRSDLPSATIILSHGSRRAGGNEPIEQLASRLGVEIAYWSVAPSLADRVSASVAEGAPEIGILPYFLFAGGITDAIGESVATLRQQFPHIKFILSEPIGNNPHLVRTLGKILRPID